MFESWALTYVPYDTKKKKKKDFKGSDIILGMEEKLLSIQQCKQNTLLEIVSPSHIIIHSLAKVSQVRVI